VRKKRNPFLAAIATLGVVGLGQLYNGQLRKAVVMYSFWFVAAAFIIFAPISIGLNWLLTALALPVLVALTAMADALIAARRSREIELKSYNRWYVYLAILFLQILLTSQIDPGLLIPSVRAFKIPTQSMSPTIEMGDRIIADMRAYQNKAPSRSDLIVFKYPLRESVSYVKRLIGLPGEVLEIRNRIVYINGHPLKENYAQYLDPGSAVEHFGPIGIPLKEYFVLGDSRDNSQDSRYWGTVKQSQILGQARYLYWAKDLSRIGKRLN
jgi:signal peptidase I